MKKRPSRPARFVAVDNGAADDDGLHVLALGLLTLLLRAKDGDDVTVEGISKRRKEGREALSGAMRNLVSRAYVVKFKIHGADGKWRTEFSADSIPFTRDDVAEMLPGVMEDARAVRVEPEWLDPRAEADRPTETRRSVATSKNTASPQVGTTYGKPAAGRSTVGKAAAKKIKTSEEEDSLSPPESTPPSEATPGSGGTGERDAATPEGPAPADVVVEAYVQALGRPLVNGSRARLRAQAVELLAVGYGLEFLVARAAEMPANGWRDLVKHAQHPGVPDQPRKGAGAPGGGRGGRERCPEHPLWYRHNCVECAMAAG